MAYTQDQLNQYFDRITLPIETRESLLTGNSPLEALTTLLHYHLSAVPFENTVLHYSFGRLFDLSPQFLYNKIVQRRQGGLCFQVTRFFAEVLLSLGYKLYMSGARTTKSASVSAKGADARRPFFGDWEHMILIVHINEQEYLVDAAFGPLGPVEPVLLRDQYEFDDGQYGRKGRLVFTNIDQGRAEHLKYWRLQFQNNGSPHWVDAYAFSESEWLEGDYHAIERAIRSDKRAWYLFRVVAFRVVLEDNHPTGWVMLWHDVVRWFRAGRVIRQRKLGSEEERMEALSDVFGVDLQEDEKREIVGTVSSLPSVSASARPRL